MKTTLKQKKQTETMVIGAILTAIVIVLQYMGQFIRLGPFAISPVLIPIVIGAAMCGPKISTWLGFIFSVIVLATDAAAFLAISIPGTIITVIAKGTACGLAAGLVYKLFEKKNKYVAVFAAAIACPIVNTGIFLLGCFVFFFKALGEWALGYGYQNAVEYMFFGLAGGNFILEFIMNIVLCPVVLRILNIRKK